MLPTCFHHSPPYSPTYTHTHIDIYIYINWTQHRLLIKTYRARPVCSWCWRPRRPWPPTETGPTHFRCQRSSLLRVSTPWPEGGRCHWRPSERTKSQMDYSTCTTLLYFRANRMVRSGFLLQSTKNSVLVFLCLPVRIRCGLYVTYAKAAIIIL